MASPTQKGLDQTPISCSFCGKTASEVHLMTGSKGGIICVLCVEELHKLVVADQAVEARLIPGTAVLGTAATTSSAPLREPIQDHTGQ